MQAQVLWPEELGSIDSGSLQSEEGKNILMPNTPPDTSPDAPPGYIPRYVPGYITGAGWTLVMRRRKTVILTVTSRVLCPPRCHVLS